MALAVSSGARVLPPTHYSRVVVSGEENGSCSDRIPTSLTQSSLSRSSPSPLWNRSLSLSGTISSAPTSAILCSSLHRRRAGGASALLRDRAVFLGSYEKELGTAGALRFHGRDQSAAGGRLDCRAGLQSVGAGLQSVGAGRQKVNLDDVPHLSEWLPDLPRFPNPLGDNPAYKAVKQYFVEDNDIVAKHVVVKSTLPTEGDYFRRAGPRENVVFQAEEVRACIVSCGGLCPGINTVIRELVCGLWTNYGVRDIIGITGGYQGFYASNTTTLNPKIVNDIHKKGGTILGTSRGGHDKTKIVAAILDRGINQVYIIGGDGTQRGANVIFQELKKLGVKVTVACIPKTVDNDIGVIDKSFGFDTAVEEAQRAINAAHVEAESVKNGVGLVKLMGRYSGYIATYATLASRDVDCCLVPEVPFFLEGEGGLYEYVRSRNRENGHMVLVVAEGAGQELISESTHQSQIDASGNQLLLDVGLWLCHSLKDHFKSGKDAITLKYIDPTYMVRAIPSNASDNVYCTLLAHSAMHGAMAGYTGFTVGPVNNRHAYIPIARAIECKNNVNVSDRMWARLLSSTNQPDFLEYDNVMEKKKKAFATSQASSAQARSVNGNGAVPQEKQVVAQTQPQVQNDEVLKGKEQKP